MIPFSGNPLDRASEKRTDTEWVEAKRRDPNSLVWPFWRLQPFLFGPEKGSEGVEAGFLKPGLAESLMGPDASTIFLGLEGEGDRQRALFAIDISAARDPANEGPIAGLGHFRDARVAASVINLKDTAIMGQAKAMIDWHQRHGFCARCGAATVMKDAGYRRVCGSCDAEHFPRTDPVVIMLATHGDACLVGRNARFPGKMFSALAGFVEPGETIEEAVRRELMEEVSVKVGKVSYLATQPWPFPSSLMIGCLAEAENRDFKCDESEIAEARWVSRADCKKLIGGEQVEGLFVPPAIAIAHHLIKAFAERE